jgi:hypothetical protein
VPATPVPAPPPKASAPSDQALILATLRDYASAYEKLDVDAVRRVYPSVNAEALAQRFKALTAQSVDISNERVQIDGTTAVVRCRVEQAFTPRIGQGRSDTLNSEFRLQKTGGRWIIVERR